MKRSMIVGVTNEEVVHPENIKEQLNKTRSLAEKQLLHEEHIFIDSDCPACQSTHHTYVFDKHGFKYYQCDQCLSVFISPRPSSQQLEKYYNNSEYALFLKSEAYETAISKFMVQLMRHRADQIIINNQKIENSGGQILLYAPKSDTLETILASNPNLSVTTAQAFQEIEKPPADISKFDLIAAFDILERLLDPIASLKELLSKLKTGGRILITLRSGSGFDLLTLWENLDLVPTEHLNLMTVEGVSTLMKDCNIDIQEISTPGQLDVQIVERISARKDVQINRFAEYIMNHRDQFAKDELQQYLQKGLLSSHLYLVGIKK